MKKLALTLLLSCAAMGSLAAKPLVIGTSSSYEPYEFINKNNELDGFDIDVMKALCSQMNAECKFNDQGFDNLIPSLQARRIDAIIAGMEVTSDREKQVLFSDIYYQSSTDFITLNADVDSIEKLQHKKVGIQIGTTSQQYLSATYPDIQPVSYDYYTNALLDLQNGRIEAIFIDSTASIPLLKNEPNLKKINDPKYPPMHLGIAVRKNNTKLQTQFNDALKAIKENGVYQQIQEKWFGN